MTKKKEDMKVRDIWNLRDARGLSYAEKAFLMVVASRGVMTAKWDTASADMGMSKNTYYKTRDSLLGKGLLNVGRRFEDTTVYAVNSEALAALVPIKDSPGGNNFSLTGNELSPGGNNFSLGGETKVTKKVTSKVTKKVTSKGTKKETSDDFLLEGGEGMDSTPPNREPAILPNVVHEEPAESVVRTAFEYDPNHRLGFSEERQRYIYESVQTQKESVGSEW